jgi:hypothetical protein
VSDITWTDTEWKTHVSEAMVEMSYAFDQFSNAKTLPEQGSAIEKLLNAWGDLKTWHPNYSYETGEIEGIYEDDESVGSQVQDNGGSAT